MNVGWLTLAIYFSIATAFFSQLYGFLMTATAFDGKERFSGVWSVRRADVAAVRGGAVIMTGLKIAAVGCMSRVAGLRYVAYAG
jgi:hypothetical protein